jgi:hypothetical protein
MFKILSVNIEFASSEHKKRMRIFFQYSEIEFFRNIVLQIYI